MIQRCAISHSRNSGGRWFQSLSVLWHNSITDPPSTLLLCHYPHLPFMPSLVPSESQGITFLGVIYLHHCIQNLGENQLSSYVSSLQDCTPLPEILSYVTPYISVAKQAHIWAIIDPLAISCPMMYSKPPHNAMALNGLLLLMICSLGWAQLGGISAPCGLSRAATAKTASSPTCLLSQLREPDSLGAGQASRFLHMTSP